MKLKELLTSGAQQGTVDWLKERLGKFTSSTIAPIVKGSGEFSLKAYGEIANVASERMLDDKVLNDEENFKDWMYLQNNGSKCTSYGTNMESLARTLYIMQTGNKVVECGLVDHPSVPFLSGSPDGLVLTGKSKNNDNLEVEGIIEIKCPASAEWMTRLRWCQNSDDVKKAKEEYYWQCQNNMNVTGAKWCDFIVYTPHLKNMIHIVRIDRNDEEIKKINERVAQANAFIVERDGLQEETD